MIKLKGASLKTSKNLLILAAVGVALLIAGSLTSEKPRMEPVEQGLAMPQGHLETYEVALASELERVLSEVEGAGRVTVTVSLKSGPESEMADNLIKTEKKTEERDQSGGVRVTTETNEQVQLAMARPTGQGDSPVEVRTLRPEIGGVLVVCDGARDPSVKMDISKAVQTLLDLPAHRVMVLPRKGVVTSGS